MPKKAKISTETVDNDMQNDVFCQQRSRLWHDGLWALRGGRPTPITISELRKKIGPYNVPEDGVIPCLQTFSMQDLIQCRRNDGTVIDNPLEDSDFERFQITPNGSGLGPNYKC